MEVIEERQVTSHRLFNSTQLLASTFVIVRFRLREFFFFAVLKPPCIPRPKIRAIQPATSALHPVTRIRTPSPHPLSLTSDSVPLGSPSDHAREGFRRHRSPLLNPEPSKRVRLYDDFDMGDIFHRYAPTGDSTLIPMLRHQGRNPSSKPLSSLLDPDSWL